MLIIHYSGREIDYLTNIRELEKFTIPLNFSLILPIIELTGEYPDSVLKPQEL